MSTREEKLAEKHPFPLIGGIRVDIKSLCSLSHRCEPLKCQRPTKCCGAYEVLVDKAQHTTIVGVMPEASKYAPTLKEGRDFIDPFEEISDGTCLATDEHGLCVFAYRDKRGATLCSIHSAALDLGLSPTETKPYACALWPLFLVESRPPILTVQDDAQEFPCNTRRGKNSRSLHPGVADIITKMLGEDFLEDLNRHLSRNQHGVNYSS